jgi:hypothetical protein
MSFELLLLLLNCIMTWIMVGVILFVQVVHYPMFARYPKETFAEVAREHQSRTFWVVMPPMILELLSSLALLVWRPPSIPVWDVWLGVMCVGIWGFSTVLLQIPCHVRLERDGFSDTVHRRLVQTNVIRTVAWLVHGMLCLGMLTRVISP